jgi:superoxide dismutase, Cu-Zn family
MTQRAFLILSTSIALAAAAPAALAASAHADMAAATPNGPGAPLGTVTIDDAPGGARITVDLHGLPPGQHGFHVHQNASCDPGPVNGVVAPAGGAGGHFDPEHTDMHMGPTGAGHLGDLPYLTVAADGTDTETLVAPRLTDVTVLNGHSLIIHAGGDNYSDQPKPLGGGGARIACGLVE